jgi:hypothetical protein
MARPSVGIALSSARSVDTLGALMWVAPGVLVGLGRDLHLGVVLATMNA